MPWTYEGGRSVGSLLFAVPPLLGTLSQTLGFLSTEIGSVRAQLRLPVLPDPLSLSRALTAALGNVANLLTSFPQAQLAASAGLDVRLGQLLALQGAIGGVIAQFSGALSAGGLHVYSYEGTTAGLPVQVPGSIPSAQGYALLIVADTPEALAALRVFLR